jgi:hypothetical protein
MACNRLAVLPGLQNDVTRLIKNCCSARDRRWTKLFTIIELINYRIFLGTPVKFHDFNV